MRSSLKAAWPSSPWRAGLKGRGWPSGIGLGPELKVPWNLSVERLKDQQSHCPLMGSWDSYHAWGRHQPIGNLGMFSQSAQ